MPEIRIKEKVKDIRTMDRVKDTANHIKKEYVRTKEQMAEKEQASSPSEYAADQAEKEMRKLGDLAGRGIFFTGAKRDGADTAAGGRQRWRRGGGPRYKGWYGGHED